MFNSHSPITMIEVKDKTNEQRDRELYYVKDPESGFSPEYNKYIVEKTIAETDQIRKKKAKFYEEQVGERVEAAMDYAFWLERGGKSGTSAEKYFGKQKLAQLHARKIMNRLFGDQMILQEYS